MIYEKEPSDFKSKFEVVSCFIEHGEQILFLLRQDGKFEGNKWGIPAGKIDESEALDKALIREVKEETGILLKKPLYRCKLFVRFPYMDFIYHIFTERLDKLPKIKLKTDENKDFIWASPKESLKMDLVYDQDNCIKLVYGLI